MRLRVAVSIVVGQVRVMTPWSQVPDGECSAVRARGGARSAHDAARSIEEYLEQLRAALDGADPGVIQEALEAAEEHLRSEVAATRGRSEARVLELITRTYGSPEDVAAVYQAEL